MAFAAAVAAALEAQPHARPDKVAGRTLLADGDGLAYSCAGNDDTSPGQARRNLEQKLEGAMRAAGADKVKVLATSSASHKGHRYAIATVKAYQGKRDHGRRPKNWQFMRQLIEQDPRTVITDTLEADDLFHINSVSHGDEHVAILTQDKDMRMVPGWHLNWDSNALVRVKPDTWAFEVDGKVFGRKWFWLQMLHGDAADNVPGLPKATIGEKQKLCGEVTAQKLLADVHSDEQALVVVGGQYAAFYTDWRTHLLEQACLLWMRRSDRLFDCVLPGGPLACLQESGDTGWIDAQRSVRSRVVDL
jgi:hypothetical protein